MLKFIPLSKFLKMDSDLRMYIVEHLNLFPGQPYEYLFITSPINFPQNKTSRLCLDQGFGEGKGNEMEKVDDSMVLNRCIVYHFHFHFLFSHQILEPNTAYERLERMVN